MFALHRLQMRSPDQLLVNSSRHFKHCRVFVTWIRSGLGFETFMKLSMIGSRHLIGGPGRGQKNHAARDSFSQYLKSIKSQNDYGALACNVRPNADVGLRPMDLMYSRNPDNDVVEVRSVRSPGARAFRLSDIVRLVNLGTEPLDQFLLARLS